MSYRAIRIHKRRTMFGRSGRPTIPKRSVRVGMRHLPNDTAGALQVFLHRVRLVLTKLQSTDVHEHDRERDMRGEYRLP